MNGKDIELTRRRVLGGLATVGAASAAAGAGTFAVFSDTESSNGNSLSAGTLDLDAGSSTTISFNSTDIKPSDSGSDNVDLQKSGSVTGDLGVSVTNVASTEGETPDSETNTSTSDNGELDDELELALWIGTGGATDTTFESGDIALLNDGSTGASKTFASAASYKGVNWTEVITSFSGPVSFNVEWNFPDQNSNNDAQGDDITVDFQFSVVQQ